MRTRGTLGGFLLFGIFLGAGGERMASPARAEEAPAVTAIGGKVSNTNSLRDLRGNRRSLHGFTGYRAVVLVFLGTECPVSNLYLPGLIELEKKYRAKQVQFLAVYANEGEDLDQVAGHAYDRDVPFPVLKDFGQRLAEQVGVSRVPAVALLDGEFMLRYRGRVDDQYGVAARRPRATRTDLVEAIEEVLAGKKVSVAETEADGCLLDRGRKQPARTDVSFSKHVAPVLQKHCQGCHRPEQAAPFALLNYDDAVRHGRMIKEVTTQRRMPPWHADARFGKFSNERRLTRAEIDTLTAWVDLGMPKGDDRDLPKPAQFPTGWVQGTPDVVFSMPEEFEVPADGVLPYKNWIIDTKFTEDKWVTMAECRPGVPAVIHHVVVYIMKEGQRGAIGTDGSMAVLVGWAPGDLGLVCPPDTALRVPKGARLRMELHYTPNGKVVKDRSSVGITFAKKPPKYELFMNEFANMTIVVPPNEPHYKAEATMRLRADARLISLVPHMHWRGKDYRYEVIYPDGKRETLLSVPRWDFNWQNVYRFQEPFKLPAGARLYAVAHWDNSKNNPLNPAPDKPVRFGLQTWEEMMVGWVSYVYERPETAEELRKDPPSQADLFFERFDHNGDERIVLEEVPEQMRQFLPLLGIKFPEKGMNREEFGKMFDEMRQRFPRPQPKPELDKKPDGKPEP